MPLRVSVTTLESFRLYSTETWKPEEELLAEIRGEFRPTPKMMLGRSGHCAMEGKPSHEDESGNHVCYGFLWTPEVIRDCRSTFRSGGVPEVKSETVLRIGQEDVTLVGKADRLLGTEIAEHKFTLSTFVPDRYVESLQWRCYCLLFEPSAVVYTVYCVAEGKGSPAEMELKETHALGFYPYRNCRDDVTDWLERFVRYVDLRGLRGFLQPRLEGV